MNIALFASAFHPHFGGVEELVRQLALELRRRGHDAIVLTNRWPRSLPHAEMFEGIPLYRVPFRAPDAGLKSAATFFLTRALIERKVRAVLNKHAVDVIHVQCVSSNGFYARRASLSMGIPLIVTLQGELTMDATQLFSRSSFARGTLRACMESAATVTGCSSHTLREGEQFFGRTLGKQGKVIFNGANVSEFATAAPYKHPKPYVFAIGRLVPQKGFDTLLRAFARATSVSSDLVLAGDGSERATLAALSEELGISRRVHFLGKADRKVVPSLFAGCEWFVLPSRADEGLPVVTAEAMAAGKAVVATRSGGAPEAIVDGVTGIIVEKEDVAGLANAMNKLAENGVMRDQMAAAGRARADSFSWKNIADQYLSLYTCVVKSPEALQCAT